MGEEKEDAFKRTLLRFTLFLMLLMMMMRIRNETKKHKRRFSLELTFCRARIITNQRIQEMQNAPGRKKKGHILTNVTNNSVCRHILDLKD